MREMYYFGVVCLLTGIASSYLLTLADSQQAHWTEWTSWQCDMTRSGCFQHRLRNCSAGIISQCGDDKEKWDIKPCTSCSEEVSTAPSSTWSDRTVFSTSATIAWWSDWEPWTCSVQTLNTSCEMYRSRNCQTNIDECFKVKGLADERKPCDGVICPAQWKDWGSWQCQNTSGVCLMLRSRECSTGATTYCGNTTKHNELINCNNTICPAHWTDWGNWQCNHADLRCVQVRYRNCSTGEINHCGDARNSWDIKTCDNSSDCDSTKITSPETTSTSTTLRTILSHSPVTNNDTPMPTLSTTTGSSTTVSSTPTMLDPNKTTWPCESEVCEAHWEPWTKWQCHYSQSCYMMRTRECSTGINSDCDNKELDWRQLFVCNDSICSRNESVRIYDWANWSEWKCKLGLNSTCTMSRSRSCSTPLQDCIGSSSELLDCTNETCPHHFGQKIDCSSFERSMSPCHEPDVCTSLVLYPDRLCRTVEETRICPISCGCCDPSLTAVTKYTNTTTNAPVSLFTEITTNSTFESNSPTSNNSETPVITTPAKLQSTMSTITATSVEWESWGKWRCKTVDHGECRMFRTRNCTEEGVIKCSTLQESRDIKECKHQVCGELFNLTLIRCADYTDRFSNCTEEAWKCTDLNPTKQACTRPEIASYICPKSCGCCDNEIEGRIVWESWSSWTCTIMESDTTSTCHRYRQRQCSTDDAVDCKGLPSETTVCNESDCSGVNRTHVDCSLYDNSSACEDQTVCTYFYDKPLIICSDPTLVAKCPLFCSCCRPPTESSSLTTYQLTLEPTTATVPVTEAITITTVVQSRLVTVGSSLTTRQHTSEPKTSVTSVTQAITATAVVKPPTSTEISTPLTEIHGHWGEWGNWRCKTVDEGKCVMFRKRNCSTGVKVHFGSEVNNTYSTDCKEHICGELFNMTYCDKYYAAAHGCTSGESSCSVLKPGDPLCSRSSLLCPKECGCCENEREGNIVWESWSPWTCNKLGYGSYSTCHMSRNRNCSTGTPSDCAGPKSEQKDCEGSDCLDTSVTHVNCSMYDNSSACENQPECIYFYDRPLVICSDPTLVAKCPQFCSCCHNEMGGQIVWESWSPWSCNKLGSGSYSTCHMSRNRNCSTGTPSDCKGLPSEYKYCEGSDCSDTSVTHVNCSMYDSSSACEDEPECTYFYDRPLMICSDLTLVAKCPRFCSCCHVAGSSLTLIPQTVSSTFTTHSNSTSTTSSTQVTTAMTFQSSESTKMSMSSTATSSHSEEWGQWQTISSSLAMTSTAMSSHWEKWSNWRCKTVDEGKCVMFRKRNCSTGVTEKCGPVENSTYSTNCTEHVCPELFNRTQCANYYAVNNVQQCTAEDSNCALLNPNHPACTVNVASTACPKSCGCCENEMEGHIVWESWSAWNCKKLSHGLNTLCHMSRHRFCSTGIQTDCEGLQSEIKDCQGSDCLDSTTTKVDCSLYDRSSVCEDQPQCIYFYDKPLVICSNPTLVAQCPHFCACCDGFATTVISSTGHGAGVSDSSTASPVTSTGNTDTSTQSPGGLQTTVKSSTGHGAGVSDLTASPVTSTGNTYTSSQSPGGLQTTLISSTGHGAGVSDSTASPVTSTGNINTSTQVAGGLQTTVKSTTGHGAGVSDSTASQVTSAGNIDTSTQSPGGLQTTVISSTGHGAGVSDSTASPVTSAGNIDTGTQSPGGLETTVISSTGHGAGVSDSTASPVTSAGNIDISTQVSGGLQTTVISSTGHGAGVSDSTASQVTSAGNIDTSTQTPGGLQTTVKSTTGHGAGVSDSTASHVTSAGNIDTSTQSPGGLQTTVISSTGHGAGVSDSTASPVTSAGNIDTGTQSPGGLQTTVISSTGHGAGVSDSTASQVTSAGNFDTSTQSPGGLETTVISSTGHGAGVSDSTASPVTSAGNIDINTQVSGGLQTTVKSSTGHGAGVSDSTASPVTSVGNIDTSTQSSVDLETTVISFTGLQSAVPNILSSTSKIPYTIPPKTTTCVQCSGPEFLCEKLYEEVDCDWPDNYCINKIVNKKDGTRSVTRGCGNFDTCYKDWFLGSSDIDKCRQFDENNFLTLDFDCTFCCIENRCNVPLRPDSTTLYKDL